MAGKRKKPVQPTGELPALPARPTAQTAVYEAKLLASGAVQRGNPITQCRRKTCVVVAKMWWFVGRSMVQT